MKAGCIIEVSADVATQYERAPATEALIDIRVESPAGVSVDGLEGLHEQVSAQYPIKKKRLFVQGQFSAGEEVGATATQKLMGFSFTSRDGKQIFQARLDGFTFSRLRPYGNWNELRDEAWRLWHIYRTCISTPKITRIAVRYINQIDIPVPQIDYKEYFRTTPEVSSDLPQGLSGFFMQLQFPQEDFGGILVLTQTAVPPPAPSTTSVILDLDVFKENADFGSDEESWALLETMRERKNKFFEGCITDKTRALFGKRREY